MADYSLHIIKASDIIGKLHNNWLCEGINMPMAIHFDINKFLESRLGLFIASIIIIIIILISTMLYISNKPFIVSLPVITDRMGTEAAMSGTLVQDIDSIPRGVIRIGSWENQKLAKAFISFDLSLLHENDEIVDAKLQLAIDNGNHNFNTERFSKILIEELSIGKTLDISDFNDSNYRIIDEIKSSQLINQQYAELDARNIVKILHRDNRKIITFRLRGEDKHHNDNNEDILRFTFTRNRTYLKLSYRPYRDTFKIQVVNIIRLMKDYKNLEYTGNE